MVSFGLRRLTRIPETMTLAAERGAVSPGTVSAPVSRSVLHAM
jgi:hypothetical protein